MKIVIASSFVPFVRGGGRFIVDWLEQKLREYGHEVDKFYLPFEERPDTLLDNLLAYRMIDLAGHGDRLIAIRPPAHSLVHPAKVVWFIHHLRGYYDLADTPHSALPKNGTGRALRDALVRHDTAALGEARAVFTNSRVVGQRLMRYNGIASEVLYPPLLDISAFRHKTVNDEILAVCRVETHKRQHLLVQAMAHVRSAVRLRICGATSDPDYEVELKDLVVSHGLQDRVTLELGWVSEERKAELVSTCLASAYAPIDEDSYGYPTLEAAAAEKPTITAVDSGGTLEFVRDGENGLIVEPTPLAVARAFDRLYHDQELAIRLGRAARDTVDQLKINWDHVVDRLLA